MPRARLLLLMVVLFSWSGIAQGQVRQGLFRRPSFEYQKRRAIRFDPYSQQEEYLGPRDSTTRPRDYYRPIPEAARGRWPQWGAPRYGYE